jgi:hypothetical protein
MAFTSRFGTSGSNFGNIIFGQNPLRVPGPQDDSLILSGSASFTVQPGGTSNLSLTLTVIDAFPTLGQPYFNSAEFDAIGSASALPGVGYVGSVTASASASFNGVLIGAASPTITMSATDSITLATLMAWNPAVTVGAIASLDAALVGTGNLALTITGKSIFNEGDRKNDSSSTDYFYVENLLVESSQIVSSNPVTNQDITAGVSAVSIVTSAVLNRTVGQTLTFVQDAHNKEDKDTVSQTYVTTQHVSNTVTHPRTIAQTLVFTQIAYRVFPVKQVLVITQQASALRVHVQSVSQTLSMAQSVVRTGTFSRSASNTIKFVQGKQQPLQLVSANGQQAVTIPAVYVSVIKQTCTMLIGVPAQTVTLPCPRLGDTQSYSGTLNLKRSMAGDTLTYVRRSNLNKFKYTWWLGRQKSLEFEDFLFNYADQLFTIMNWKGETWIAYLMTSPFEFSPKERYQPQGERVEVTLEFEGVKIGG